MIKWLGQIEEGGDMVVINPATKKGKAKLEIAFGLWHNRAKDMVNKYKKNSY